MNKKILIFNLLFIVFACSSERNYQQISSIFNIEMVPYEDFLQKFKLNYPKDWKIIQMPGYIFYTSQRALNNDQKVHLNFNISLIGENLSLKEASKLKEREWYDSEIFNAINIHSKNSAYFGDEEAIDYEVSATSLDIEIYWYYKLMRHKNRIYGFSTTCQSNMISQGNEIYQLILESFKWH